MNQFLLSNTKNICHNIFSFYFREGYKEFRDIQINILLIYFCRNMSYICTFKRCLINKCRMSLKKYDIGILSVNK